MAAPDASAARSHFPALSRSDWALLENAGGSQVPQQLIDSVSAYFASSYVQLGAGYPMAAAADATVASARRLVSAMASESPESGFCLLGASSTTLLNGLAAQWAQVLKPGDAVVVATAGHEANVGCWARACEQRGAELLWWHPAGTDGEDTAPLGALEALLSSRPNAVRLVAFPHVSNLLGGVSDVAAAAALARAHGARVVVDSVAFAPHRRLKAAEWGADWLVWSCYKVYGPHAAVLYGSNEAWAGLRAAGAVPPNHFFIVQSGYGVAAPAAGAGSPWYPYEPGGPSHEACAALCGTRAYLAALAAHRGPFQDSLAGDVELVSAAFELMEAMEMPLQQRMAAYLEEQAAAGRLRMLGPRGGGLQRVPTFSFVPLRTTPHAVVAACHAARVACRSGHMYAHRLCTRIGVETEAGAVRVSAVHYNTEEEVERAIAAIDAALGEH